MNTDLRRSWMAVDWGVRVHAPVWLELAGFNTLAESLRELSPICDLESSMSAYFPVRYALEYCECMFGALRYLKQENYPWEDYVSYQFSKELYFNVNVIDIAYDACRLCATDYVFYTARRASSVAELCARLAGIKRSVIMPLPFPPRP